MKVLRLILDYPHKDLNPNSNRSYHDKAKLKTKQKNDAFLIAKNSQFKVAPEALNYIPLRLVFHRANKVRYDLDNALASMKSALDGVALAIGIDDSRFAPITIDHGTDHDGTVKITIGHECDGVKIKQDSRLSYVVDFKEIENAFANDALKDYVEKVLEKKLEVKTENAFTKICVTGDGKQIADD